MVSFAWAASVEAIQANIEPGWIVDGVEALCAVLTVDRLIWAGNSEFGGICVLAGCHCGELLWLLLMFDRALEGRDALCLVENTPTRCRKRLATALPATKEKTMLECTRLILVTETAAYHFMDPFNSLVFPLDMYPPYINPDGPLHVSLADSQQNRLSKITLCAS